jgi:hypothetical protein
MEARDWFIMLFVAAAWAAGTVFIFKFGTKDNAALLLPAWGSVCCTMGGIYHWLCVRDAKTKDADNGNS